MAHRGNDDFDRLYRRGDRSDRFAEYVDQAFNLRGAATGENENDRGIRHQTQTQSQRCSVCVLNLIEFFDQRVPDVRAGRPAEARVRIRLEG